MKKLIIVSGYAQSGKTSMVNYIKTKYGYNIASTSEVLGRFSEAIAKHVAGVYINTDDKRQSAYINKRVLSSRDLKIAIAENCIAPILSRKVLVCGFENGIRNSDVTVYEAFNYEEYNDFLSLYAKYFSTIDIVIVRRHSEKPDVDERELLEDTSQATWHLHNHSQDLEAWYRKIDEMLSVLATPSY